MHWSPVLFDLSNVIFGTEKTPDPKNLGGVQSGARISTVLGYRYPDLETLFESERLVREDTPDQEKVLLKMTAGRTPYAISDPLHLLWYQRVTPSHRLAKWTLPLDINGFHCAVPKNSRVSASRIFKSLDELKKSGRIEAILRSYR